MVKAIIFTYRVWLCTIHICVLYTLQFEGKFMLEKDFLEIIGVDFCKIKDRFLALQQSMYLP